MYYIFFLIYSVIKELSIHCFNFSTIISERFYIENGLQR